MFLIPFGAKRPLLISSIVNPLEAKIFVIVINANSKMENFNFTIILSFNMPQM